MLHMEMVHRLLIVIKTGTLIIEKATVFVLMPLEGCSP